MSVRLSIAATVGIFAAGCVATSGNASEAALGVNFQLAAGESVAVKETTVEVGFIAVETDSRCGKGAACVWEGDATVRVWVRRAGGPRDTLELHTAARKPAVVSYGDFSLRLVSLTPYPISGHTIPASAYVVTLKLTRGDDADETPRGRAPH